MVDQFPQIVDGFGGLLLLEQLTKRNPECSGELLDIAQGEVPFTSFDAGNISPVQAAFLGHIFLRPFLPFAKLSDLLAKAHQNGILLFRFPYHGDGSYL